MEQNGNHGATTGRLGRAQALDGVVHALHGRLASPVSNVEAHPEGSGWGMADPVRLPAAGPWRTG